MSPPIQSKRRTSSRLQTNSTTPQPAKLSTRITRQSPAILSNTGDTTSVSSGRKPRGSKKGEKESTREATAPKKKGEKTAPKEKSKELPLESIPEEVAAANCHSPPLFPVLRETTLWQKGKLRRTGIFSELDPKKHSDGSAAGMGTSLSTNVAAASTTAVYKKNYGSPDPSLTVTEDGDAGDFSDEEEDDVFSLDSGRSPIDIDDDDYVDIDEDSEEEERLAFQRSKDGKKKNYILGGPQARDTRGMTAAEAKFVELEDKKKRKQWTDQQRQKRLKKNTVGSPPPKKLGFTSDRLRTMVDVEANRLLPDHMFPTKEIFWMRIGEEALLRNIHVRAIRSDHANLVVKGPNFHVAGNFREGLGWTCKVAVCREGDDLLLIPPIGKYENERAPLKTPLSYLWVVPIFRQSVEKKPGVDYEALRDLLRPYANEYAITDAILQEGRETAKVSIFGTPEENAGYAEAVAATMRSLGHEVELVYTTRAETLANINTVVV